MLAHLHNGVRLPLPVHHHAGVAQRSVQPLFRDGGLGCFACKVLPDLPEQPGHAQGPPADRDAGAAGDLQNLPGILPGEHIAIGDHRDLQGLAHGGDCLPVRLAGVLLHAGAAVDGEAVHPLLLGHAGKGHGVDAVLVPADAHLEGQGQRGGLAGGAH